MVEGDRGVPTAPLGAESLAAWWPHVSRRVTTGLVRRGVSADVADDVVQETAARTWATRPAVASEEELARWAFTVAHRVWIDSQRRMATAPTLSSLTAADATTSTIDVERTVEARLDFQRVARGMAALAKRDRDVLLRTLDDGDGPKVDRSTQVREAVQRHRARIRLATIMTRLAGVLVGVRAAWRQLVRVVPAPVVAVTLLTLTVPALRLLPDGSPADGASRSPITGAKVELADQASTDDGATRPGGEAGRDAAGATHGASSAGAPPPGGPRTAEGRGVVVTVGVPDGPINRPPRGGDGEPTFAVCGVGVAAEGEAGGVPLDDTTDSAREGAFNTNEMGCPQFASRGPVLPGPRLPGPRLPGS